MKKQMIKRKDGSVSPRRMWDNPELLTKVANYLIKHKAQNAEIGRIGTAPAEMGGMQTQGMEQ